jgi:tetratricopeptide (TPR) repeat protein
MVKKITIVVIFSLAAFVCYGQSNFSRGEDFFMQNKPAEAVVFLESAIADDPSRAVSYLYLGIVYEQLGKIDEAIAVYRRALPVAGNLSANVANNLGNVYFKKGNIEEAERYYSQAIGFDSVYSAAYLGRANTRIKAGNLQNAISDYEQYLTLEPLSGQRQNIENLLALIRAEFTANEMRRQMAEAEERRLAEERQNLLDSVSASLQSAADASKGISSGAEGVEGYENEFVLE